MRWCLSARGCALGAAVCLTVGCGGQVPAPAAAPPAPKEAAESPAGGTASTAPSATEGSPAPDQLPPLPDELPPAAETCPQAGPLPPAGPVCPQAIEQLAEALTGTTDDVDSRLASLEACPEFARGMVRVLRAERAPLCADALVEPVVGRNAAPAQGEAAGLRSVLVGLGLGSRLRRAVQDPPPVPHAASQGELEEYFAESLFPWASAQSKAIFAMASQGSQLAGYARGVVAIEAGMADMRFVDMARAVPLPDDMRKDAEISDVYYAALDEALEPRKARGRDAALVGLAEFARAGITQSDRLDVARQLIARVYAGHRIMALDALQLPEPGACAGSTPLERLARSVVSPHANQLIAPLGLTDGVTLCLLQRGLPVFLARVLQASERPLDELRLAWGEFRLGQTYFMASHFQQAEAALSRALDAEESGLAQKDLTSAQLLRALAVGLMAGPQSPVELFRYGSRFPRPLGDLTLLDAVAEGPASQAGLAQFDSAYLRELSPVEGSPDFWKDLARRYEQASTKLSGEGRREARARGEAARQTARTLQNQLQR